MTITFESVMRTISFTPTPINEAILNGDLATIAVNVWFYLVFIGVPYLFIYVIIAGKKEDREKQELYNAILTFDEYRKMHPDCKSGIKCHNCGSKSIKNWGRQHANDSERLFICNHCNTTLYRN